MSQPSTRPTLYKRRRRQRLDLWRQSCWQRLGQRDDLALKIDRCDVTREDVGAGDRLSKIARDRWAGLVYRCGPIADVDPILCPNLMTPWLEWLPALKAQLGR